VELANSDLRVVVIGGASWNTMIRVERFPEPRSGSVHPLDWHDAVGSSGAGKALNLARLGVSTTLSAALGDDEEGRRVAAFLTEAGIDLIRASNPDGTARHVNLMDGAGRRLSILLERRTEPEIDLVALERAVAAADAVCLEVVDHARHLVPVIQGHGPPIWTDLHAYDGVDPYHQAFIEAADVVLLAGDQLENPRIAMELLRGQGRRLVVCTLAERGAIALDRDGRWHEVPAQPARVVDTNGAGDAYAAGLLVGTLMGLALEDALAMAARTAAIAIGSRDLTASDLTLARVLPSAGG
jgi:sugar/nucleoside kinase (ribokinase family)